MHACRGPKNVRVNSIAPGNVWTPLFAECVELMDEPHRVMEKIARQQRLGNGSLIAVMSAPAIATEALVLMPRLLVLHKI